MYNVWWIVIGLAAILIPLIILLVVKVESNKRLSERRGYTEDDDAEVVLSALTSIFAFVLLISISISLISPLSVKREYNDFIETKVMVEQVVDLEQEELNIALNHKILEMNKWLVGAKSAKKTYGKWSAYYFIEGLDQLEYIKVK